MTPITCADHCGGIGLHALLSWKVCCCCFTLETKPHEEAGELETPQAGVILIPLTGRFCLPFRIQPLLRLTNIRICLRLKMSSIIDTDFTGPILSEDLWWLQITSGDFQSGLFAQIKNGCSSVGGVGGWGGQLTETRRRVGGDDFVFSHTENSTVSVPDWMVKTGLAAGQTFAFAPQFKLKTNKPSCFIFYPRRKARR